MQEIELLSLITGIIGTSLINLIPFVNRRLDKITSSQGAQIAFYFVEVVEAFEDGKLTKEEVERTIDNLKLLLDDIQNNHEKIRTNRKG